MQSKIDAKEDMDLTLAPVTELTQTLQESNRNSIEAFLEDVHYGKHIPTAGVINEKPLRGGFYYPAADWFQAWQSYIELNQLSDHGILSKKAPHVSFGVQFAKKGKVLQYFHIKHSSKEGNSYRITMEPVRRVTPFKQEKQDEEGVEESKDEEGVEESKDDTNRVSIESNNMGQLLEMINLQRRNINQDPFDMAELQGLISSPTAAQGFQDDNASQASSVL